MQHSLHRHCEFLAAFGGDSPNNMFSYPVIARSESPSDAAITFHRDRDASAEKGRAPAKLVLRSYQFPSRTFAHFLGTHARTGLSFAIRQRRPRARLA